MNRFRVLILCVLIFSIAALVLTGCKPPKKDDLNSRLSEDGGKRIITVTPENPGPFRTVEIDGAELIQARGELGEFGGTFRDNQIGDGPKTFNPWASFDNTSSTLGGMMFSGLTTVDAFTGEIVPYMAKEVKVQDDKMTYLVTLRKGLKWSDGHPITSEDVVFTWNTIIKEGLGNPSTRDINLIDGKFPEVKAIDPLTVQFKTAKPYSPFMLNLGANIAPAHILKPVATQGNKAFSAFWGVSDAAKKPQSFVSSGMWLIEKYEPRQQVIFKRNPNFFMVDKKGRRLPYLDRYVVRFVGDQNAEQLEFEQGKSDIYSVPGKFVSHVRQLKTPDFTLYNLGPTTSTTFFAFNLNTRKDPATGKPLVDPKKSAWFNDVNFRQAVALTINRDDIVSNILKGVGEPLYTAESLSSVYLNADLAERMAREANDIEKARTLLKTSGFTWKRNADGVEQLYDKHGNRVVFSLFTNSGNNEREAIGVNIKQDLSKLGIQVDFKPMDFNVLGNKLQDGQWETMIMGLTGFPLEPNTGKNVWVCDGSLHLFFQRSKPGEAKTDTSDCLPWEKEIDRIFNEGAQIFEREERRKLYDRYQEIIAEQAPIIYLYSPLQVVAVRNHLRNVNPTVLGGVTHNLEEIWVAK